MTKSEARKLIRPYFTDFRYLTSRDEPTMREFVRYEEVVSMVQELLHREVEPENLNFD